MKKIINGKIYDTDTATEVADFDSDCDRDWDRGHQILYIKETGECFLYGEEGTGYQSSIYFGYSLYADCCSAIKPLTPEEAKDWLADHNFVDEYIKYFGEPEE